MSLGFLQPSIQKYCDSLLIPRLDNVIRISIITVTILTTMPKFIQIMIHLLVLVSGNCSTFQFFKQTNGRALWCTEVLAQLTIINTIAAHRRMWSLTNYFLVNLALADLGMATLNCIPSFIFMRDR